MRLEARDYIIQDSTVPVLSSGSGTHLENIDCGLRLAARVAQ